MRARETFFHCRYRSADVEWSGSVRAWNENEAAKLFEAELSSDPGARAPGMIEVVDAADRPILTTPYQPPAP